MRWQTFLLEKIRLVHQQSGETNFHVFGLLVHGASEGIRELLHITQV